MLDKIEELWPPDYVSVIRTRNQRLKWLCESRPRMEAARAVYKQDPVLFIEHWGVIREPRVIGDAAVSDIPFVPFNRQVELIEFLHSLLKESESGLVEKSRDMGATWTCCWFSIWLYLFVDGSTVGWGSRDADLVDRKGDPDSIIEKIRIGLRKVPRIFLPKRFSLRDHTPFMRVLNPETGATIVGDVGDNIGRGGRSLIYFKDEAQPLDAKILTPTGWQFMDDMKVGTEVVGFDGRPTKVTQIKDLGVYDIYRVTFSDGTSTECSPGHLWKVDKVIGKRESLVVATSELARSYVNKWWQYKYRIPVITASVRFAGERRKLPLDPYLVGCLLGDGSLPVMYTPSITTADQEIVDSFNSLLPIGCALVWDGAVGYRLIDTEGRRFGGRHHKSRAKLAVTAAGISGFDCYSKFVPDLYKFSSPQNRLSVLQGLMDTDGFASPGGAPAGNWFFSASRQLALDVRFLIQSLGGTATFNIKPDHRGFADIYALCVVLPSGMKPFRLSRKLSRLRPRKHPFMRTITSMEVIGRKPVRCISVDNTDGLYLTNDCIVTHNSAHYIHAEQIEAALSDNAAVQVDISSVHGLGNVFHRRREEGVEWFPGAELPKGKTRVFILDWRDHPGKTQEWYDIKRQKAEAEGLLHIFAQEVDRDYAAAVEGVIIPGQWVKAAIDAHIKLGFKDDGGWCAALDVADEGGDTNVLSKRKGIVLREVKEWGERDTGVTARNAVDYCKDILPVQLQYDSIGVGAGVKAETNRLRDEQILPKGLRLVPWNAGAEVQDKNKHVNPHDKDSPKNSDFFANLKAQAAWALRRRFELTYRAINEKGFTWDSGDLISIDSHIPLLRKIEKELSQPTFGTSSKMKMMVNKKPDGSKSPNIFDSIVMNYFPMKSGQVIIPEEALRRSGMMLHPLMGRMRRF